MNRKRVLFIGNSYTFFNDLPGMFADLSNAAGRPVETAAVTSGGKALEWHWYNPETLDAVRRGGWDFVVLQDHSQRPVEDPDRLLSAARRFASRIREVDAEPVLYMTWARRHIPESQDAISRAYVAAARETGARVAPVGIAWRKALAGSPELVLHTEDRSHPNVLGSYLAACVFYATLLGASPVDLPSRFRTSERVTTVIDEDVAAFLREAARDTCQEFAARSA